MGSATASFGRRPVAQLGARPLNSCAQKLWPKDAARSATPDGSRDDAKEVARGAFPQRARASRKSIRGATSNPIRRGAQPPHRSSPHRDHTMRALVFDFDGLILDTETSGYEAWRTRLRGARPGASKDRWLTRIGTDGSGFDPLAELRARVGGTLDAEQIRHRRMAFHRAQIEQLDQMPGVRACLEHARAESIGTAIASSSPFNWVNGHIERLGLSPLLRSGRHRRSTWTPQNRHRISTFAPPNCSAWTPATRSRWRIRPMASSPRRPLASTAFAVPGPMTRTLSFEAADAVLPSLDARPAGEWIAQAAAARDARNADQRVISSR